MTKTRRSLAAVLFIALGMLAFYLAAQGGYGSVSPNVLGIAGFILLVIAGGMVGMDFRIRR